MFWLSGVLILYFACLPNIVLSSGRIPRELTFDDGLKDGDILEWSGRTAAIERMSYLRFFRNNGIPIGRIVIKGGRNKLEVQVRGMKGAGVCKFGNNLIAMSTKFHILVLPVNGTHLSVYLNRQRRLDMPLNAVGASPRSISRARHYGFHATSSFRLLDEATLGTEIQDSNCGLVRTNRSVPGFCRSASSKSPCRIVGGSDARPGANPWQAAIRDNYQRRTARHICGATLIGENWAITAGHCFASTSQLSYRNLVVRVGDYNNRDGEAGSSSSVLEKSVDLRIEEVIRHPRYNPYPYPTHDIALIKLKDPANFNSFVLPACLSKSNNQFQGRVKCGISGWGASKFRQDASKYPKCLQFATVQVKNRAKCESLYQNRSFNSEWMMCANSPCADSCQGDSGGPLICKEIHSGREQAFLWGITSWGVDCGNPKKPGVYTRLSKYISWIFKETMLNHTIPQKNGTMGCRALGS